MVRSKYSRWLHINTHWWDHYTNDEYDANIYHNSIYSKEYTWRNFKNLNHGKTNSLTKAKRLVTESRNDKT